MYLLFIINTLLNLAIVVCAVVGFLLAEGPLTCTSVNVNITGKTISGFLDRRIRFCDLLVQRLNP